MIHNLRWCVFWRSFSMSFTSNILYIFSSTSVVRSWLFFVESVSICCSPFCYFCFLQDTAPSFCILSLLLHVLEDPMACHNAIFLPNDKLHLISEMGNNFIVEPGRIGIQPQMHQTRNPLKTSSLVVVISLPMDGDEALFGGDSSKLSLLPQNRNEEDKKVKSNSYALLYRC